LFESKSSYNKAEKIEKNIISSKINWFNKIKSKKKSSYIQIGDTPLTPNMGIIIKYSRLTITITAKILRPNPHFSISGKVEDF